MVGIILCYFRILAVNARTYSWNGLILCFAFFPRNYCNHEAVTNIYACVVLKMLRGIFSKIKIRLDWQSGHLNKQESIDKLLNQTGSISLQIIKIQTQCVCSCVCVCIHKWIPRSRGPAWGTSPSVRQSFHLHPRTLNPNSISWTSVLPFVVVVWPVISVFSEASAVQIQKDPRIHEADQWNP